MDSNAVFVPPDGLRAWQAAENGFSRLPSRPILPTRGPSFNALRSRAAGGRLTIRRAWVAWAANQASRFGFSRKCGGSHRGPPEALLDRRNKTGTGSRAGAATVPRWSGCSLSRCEEQERRLVHSSPTLFVVCRPSVNRRDGMLATAFQRDKIGGILRGSPSPGAAPGRGDVPKTPVVPLGSAARRGLEVGRQIMPPPGAAVGGIPAIRVLQFS